MDVAAIRGVVDVWADQTSDLGERFRWVQVFENRGAAMGASNPHPHGQIWSGDALPVEAEREDAEQARHRADTGRRLLVDYAEAERGGPRVIRDAGGWLTLVPFWAAWPFEAMLVPLAPAARLADLDAAARDGLAEALRDLNLRYDGLFRRPFPFSMGWHQAPFGGAPDGPLAGSRALLPAAPARHGAQVHGGLRAAVRAAAGPDARGGGRPAARRPGLTGTRLISHLPRVSPVAVTPGHQGPPFDH